MKKKLYYITIIFLGVLAFFSLNNEYQRQINEKCPVHTQNAPIILNASTGAYTVLEITNPTNKYYGYSTTRISNGIVFTANLDKNHGVVEIMDFSEFNLKNSKKVLCENCITQIKNLNPISNYFIVENCTYYIPFTSSLQLNNYNIHFINENAFEITLK